MEMGNITSLAERLHKLFGQEAEERKEGRRRMMEQPAITLKEMGFDVDEEVIRRFERLDDRNKEQIIDHFEMVSRYDTDFRENPAKRIEVLKKLKSVFEVFLLWEEPLEEERTGW